MKPIQISPPKIDGPLIFGNKEHIQLVRMYEDALWEANKPRHVYEVEIDFSGYASVEVEAEDEEEAKDLAEMRFSVDDSEIDFNRVNCKIKKFNPEVKNG